MNPRHSRQGFSLVELLTVVALVALLAGLTAPVVGNLGDARSVGRTVYQVADVLQQARAQAMARNTYVAVGIADEQDATPRPARENFVVLAGRMSTDGTRPASWGSSANIVDLGKLYRFDRLTLASVSDTFGGTKQTADLQIQAVSTASGFTRSTGNTRFDFRRVLEFSPTGEMRVVDQPLKRVTEIGLASANRSNDPARSAALQIAGLTGAVRVFRP